MMTLLAALLKSARIRRNDRPAIDPFPIDDAEALIAALHWDWGEAQGNYDKFRFFTGLRPSEEIALLVSDFDPVCRALSVSKARVGGIDRKITETGRVPTGRTLSPRFSNSATATDVARTVEGRPAG